MATSKNKGRILILDDDPDLVEALSGVLEEQGFEVHRRGTRSVGDVVAVDPELVMIDCPPGAKGEVLKFVQQMRLRREIQHVPIVLGVTSQRLLEPAILRERAIHVLVRPFSIDELLAAVSHLLEAGRRVRQKAG